MSIGDIFFACIEAIMFVAFWVLVYNVLIAMVPICAIHSVETGIGCVILWFITYKKR